MKQIQIAPDIVPRLPVLGWAVFDRTSAMTPPTLLESAHLRYTTSGRAAIGLALQVLGVGPSDRVLIPTYHCPTMVAPAVFVGAEPLFFPITETGAARLDVLERRELPRVKAMIAAHYFGIPQPMKHVREFCDRHGIALIEDCAHAIFGMSDGRSIGAWGDLAIASTPKFFATPTGGCLVSATRSVETISLKRHSLAAELREFVNAVELSVRFGRLTGLNWLLASGFRAKDRLFGHAQCETPQALAIDPHAEVNAEVPLGAFDPDLATLESTRVTRCIVRATNRSRLVARRRDHYRRLTSAFAELPGARLLFPELPASAVPYVLPVWVDNPDERYYALKRAGIPVFRWDWLWAGTPLLCGDHGRSWSRHVFQFPCHQDLTSSNLDVLVERVKAVFAALPAGIANSGQKHGYPVLAA